MRNYFKISVLLLLLVVSCKDEKKPKDVPIVNQTPSIIIDDIMMEMPGVINLTDKYIIINNPLAADKFYVIFDRNSYEKINQLGVKGKSNIEFMFPSIVINSNEKATLYDMNYNRYVEYDLNNFEISDNSSGDIDPDILTLYNKCNINDEIFVGINYLKAGNIIYLCNKKEVLAKYGKFPVDDEFTEYMHNFGELYFDKTDSVLHYMSNHLPYYEKYKFTNNRLELLSSERYAEFDYTIKDNVFSANSESVINGVFTKDYIINLDNLPTEKALVKNEMRMVGDYSKLPHCLYLYDKELNLKKIVDVGMPILGLVACDGDSNTIYIKCYVDTLFKLAKLDL